MKIKYTEETPRKIRDYEDIEPVLSSEEVADIAEIFKTPLTGTYNWDYTVQDNRIAKLYELGKKLNWNVSMDIDCLLYTSPSPRDGLLSRMPSSA